ncbi:SDR family oxidoreductase [Aquirufa sp. 2-AUSEE-184A6]|uniref:SDR family oxidoreductase n=1 Tax=Aquirufa novilacunae TaxID=3139305 RepID=A0ABW8STM2_9BACT
MFKLTHKKVVITGGCSGIGKSIAITFLAQGAEVHVIDLKAPAEPLPADITLHLADITNIDSVQAIAIELGSIDILVNNAGIPQIGNLEKTSPSDFQIIFDVNVKGAYHCMYAFIPGMIQQKSGVILNMASVAASVGIPDRFGYSMTKGAIKSMTQSVAKDYINQGIRCNCISPGRVHTPFVDGFIAKNYPDNQAEMFAKLSATQPIGRMAQPQEIAHLALYLCSDEAAFITGCDYPIDGGFIYLNN